MTLPKRQRRRASCWPAIHLSSTSRYIASNCAQTHLHTCLTLLLLSCVYEIQRAGSICELGEFPSVCGLQCLVHHALLLSVGLTNFLFPSKHFCFADIMYSLEIIHFLLDEMVQNGHIVETNKMNVLRPLDLMERESQKAESIYR
jgi:Clathrin adaptor complex small chain